MCICPFCILKKQMVNSFAPWSCDLLYQCRMLEVVRYLSYPVTVAHVSVYYVMLVTSSMWNDGRSDTNIRCQYCFFSMISEALDSQDRQGSFVIVIALNFLVSPIALAMYLTCCLISDGVEKVEPCLSQVEC